MKKDFDQEKAKIIVTIIPFVLIILVLLVSLIVSKTRNQGDESKEALQESIKDYTDSNLPDLGEQDKDAAHTVEQDDSGDSQKKATDTSTSVSQNATAEEEDIDYSAVTFDADAQLTEMMTYWADNNQAALDDLAVLDRFRAMSAQLKGSKDYLYAGDKDASGQPSGTGIAVYADNQYYYGEWKNGKREGNGTWIHYHFHAGKTSDIYTYHQYTGSFAGDLPDGEGSEHYDFNTELLKKNTRYIGNRIGTYRKGLIDGEFYLTTIDSTGNMEEFTGTATAGSWVYQNANKDKKGNRTVLVKIENQDDYIWMQPSENTGIGVPCLISDAWG